ncbi:MAG: trypsin-like peptidase domain-containing protein, partial [Chloroflexi bacterium]|nr:trypsin-like peptidase domain-containing protein [Chloroflexota bacterium]
WSSRREPVAATPVPPRRGLGAMAIVVIAVIAGILSGALSALAVTNLLPPPVVDDETADETPVGNPVSNVSIDESSAVIEAVSRVAPAVVTIEGVGGGLLGAGTGTGSGFIFDADGWILTNRHVIESAQNLTVVTNEGREYPAEVYGTDTLTDLAIIKIEASNLPTAEIGTSADLEPGQIAIAIGNPLGYENSVTTGVVSGLGRHIQATDAAQSSPEDLNNLIQTDAAINPGNSGGPLVNSAGQVIGVNTAVSTSDEGRGIGFAIPIDVARPIMEQALAGQELTRPWIGVSYVPVDPALAVAENLPVEYGALVATSVGGGDPIFDGSPADQAGLQAGDVIVAVNGEQITASRDLSTLLLDYSPGDTVTLRVLRENSTSEIQLTLAERPSE